LVAVRVCNAPFARLRAWAETAPAGKACPAANQQAALIVDSTSEAGTAADATAADAATAGDAAPAEPEAPAGEAAAEQAADAGDAAAPDAANAGTSDVA